MKSKFLTLYIRIILENVRENKIFQVYLFLIQSLTIRYYSDIRAYFHISVLHICKK
jgi:hypothetical protein